jgi:hypothetical protein
MNGWHQVRKGLANARGRFYAKMVPFIKGAGNFMRHAHLLRPEFVADAIIPADIAQGRLL